MGSSFSISIADVVQLLGLEIDPKTNAAAPSFNVRCPFCDTPSDRRYHMNISNAKDAYRCVRCSGDGKSLGVLDLYSRVRFGCSATDKGTGTVYRSLTEELHRNSYVIPTSSPGRRVSSAKVLKPASDEKLDAAYSALLQLPYIGLTAQHRLNLLRRGLGTPAIAGNGYGSIILNERFTQHPYFETAREIYREKRESIGNNPKLAKQKKLSVIAGLIISHDLERKGVDLRHVPGFFLLDGVRCMKTDEGMLIPTRNREGQIVGIQTRTDPIFKDGLRYITLSSKDLDGGPNTDISRVHFPLGNTAPEHAELVGLTEGPLKADIAVSLFGKPVYIMAVQGVNNTRELNSIISCFDGNIRTVRNMLDMDRFVNVHVQKAAKAIEAKFREKNIEFQSFVWDIDSLSTLFQDIRKTCSACGIACPELTSGREDEWIRQVFNAFSSKQLSLEKRYSACIGKAFEWKSESKGIDDYLNRIRRKGQ